MRRKKVAPQVKKKTHKQKHLGSWVNLPYPAVVKVLENLADFERVKTAQVCQNWRVAFHNPVLWRSRHFYFGGPKSDDQGQNALAFARTKGSFLRRVYVKCRHVTSNTCEGITATLESFVGYLTGADLEELRISGLELDRFWKYAHLRVKVADSLRELLRGKQNLKALELTHSQFGLLPGTEVLETVYQSCGHTLSSLLLENFFHSRLAAFELDRFKSVLQGFDNLRVVALNYCCLCDDLVRLWAHTLRGKLTSLQIKASDDEPHEHIITGASWKELVSACPKLTVDLSIFGISPASSVIPILSGHAPLTALYIRAGYDNDFPLQLSDTLNHIVNNYRTKLLSLCFDFDNYQDDIDDALVHVVSYCRNMQRLKIRAYSSIVVVNAVCQLVREGRTRLTSADLMLYDESDPDMTDVSRLKEEVEPLAKERGISLVLHDEFF